MHARRAATCLLAALALAPSLARAETEPAVWRAEWPRFRLWEYAATAGLGVGFWVYERNAVPPDQPRRTGGILFDGAVRGWLVAKTPGGRAGARKMSDVLWLGGSAFPFVVDLPVALLAHRQPVLTWQLLMMDLEAYAVSGFVNRLLENEVGRARPSIAGCAVDPAYDELCGAPGNNASFPSGHTLGIATAAGLTCIHHRYLPLYGHPLADAGACALMSLATAATAVGRVVADRHHASDVIGGAALGFGIGYTLPWLLHYRYGGAPSGESRALLIPLVGASTVGAAVVGGL
jgi:membrane-associated phospholipid phosphatase